jgi:D-alanyl-D-alanine carboxypeptidase
VSVRPAAAPSRPKTQRGRVLPVVAALAVLGGGPAATGSLAAHGARTRPA